MVRNENAIKQNEEVFRECIRTTLKSLEQNIAIALMLIDAHGGNNEDRNHLSTITKEELKRLLDSN